MAETCLLADQGQAKLRLAVAPDQRDALLFAVDELTRYLAIITGAWFEHGDGAGPSLRLTIESAEREQHGWRISDGGVVLHGSDALSVLHAVYAFLEAHGGCQWLSEFEGGEVIPRRERLEVPAETQTFTPAMTHRAFTNFPDIDRRTAFMVDWMAKRRFNRFMIFANMGDSFVRYEQVLQRELAGRHMQVELGHHSFKFFLPPDEFFATHHEYYAEVGGQRVTDGQVCTSHPAVAEIMAERVCGLFAAHPEIGTVGLWPNDGYGWCECARCQAQEPQEPAWPYEHVARRTDTYLQFVNRVAELVAPAHPDRDLSALAYVNYVQPPRFTTLAPNVRLCFAPFQRCFKHPLAAPPECKRRNAAYMDMLQQWRAMVPGTLYLFEYLMLIDMCSIPYPITGLLPKDFRDYASLGVDGYVLEFKPEEWGLFGMNANLIGQLSWNSGTDSEGFLAEHYSALYGPAAEEMAGYFAQMQHLLADLGPCVGHYDLDYTLRATDQLLRPAAEHLGRAIAISAGAHSRYREAVRAAQVGFHVLRKIHAWRQLIVRLREARPEKRKARLEDVLRAGDELVAWTGGKARKDLLDRDRIALVVRTEHEALQRQYG